MSTIRIIRRTLHIHGNQGGSWISSRTNRAILASAKTVTNDSSINNANAPASNNSVVTTQQTTNDIKSYSRFRLTTNRQSPLEIPPDPHSLLTPIQQTHATNQLLAFLQTHDSILVITGAGLSTESGIPDYRGSNGSYQKGHQPMVHDQFMGSESSRQRYWGRSLVGWRAFSGKEPNRGHLALMELERMGCIGVEYPGSSVVPPSTTNTTTSSRDVTPSMQRLSIITQNVDGLHDKAQTTNVIDLHGRTDTLICTTCGHRSCRNAFHDQLETLNEEWLSGVRKEAQTTVDETRDDLRPDGDANIATEDYTSIRIPACSQTHTHTHTNTPGRIHCEGFLKPDVVFFGDTVPKERVQECYDAVRAADGLLCIGSSLAVHSAFRFVTEAAKLGIDVAVLNVGITRAETTQGLFEGVDRGNLIKIESPAGETLESAVEALRNRQHHSTD